MIDLRFPLPETVQADGREWRVRTGWRWWLEFGELLKEGIVWHGVLEDDEEAGEALSSELMRALASFYACEDELPRETDAKHHERTLDLMVDGGLVVAAFQQAYGIDLTSPDADGIHWHRFCALLRALPGDTALSKVMGIRGWTADQDKVKHEDAMRKAQAAWRLRDEGEIEALEWADRFFGGTSSDEQ